MMSRVSTVAIAAFVAVCAAALIGGVSGQQPGLVYSSDMESDNVADPTKIRCEACQAIARALLPKMEKLVHSKYKGGRMVAIASMIEEVCTPESFRVYEFSPPDMIEACRAFRADYEEQIEELASTKTKIDDLKARTKLCADKEICPAGLWEKTKPETANPPKTEL